MIAACRCLRHEATEELLTLLVDRGADVNKIDSTGNTILMTYLTHYICDIAVAKLLLDAGVDLTVKNKEGKTVYDLLKLLLISPIYLSIAMNSLLCLSSE